MTATCMGRLVTVPVARPKVPSASGAEEEAVRRSLVGAVIEGLSLVVERKLTSLVAVERLAGCLGDCDVK